MFERAEQIVDVRLTAQPDAQRDRDWVGLLAATFLVADGP